MNLRPLNRQLMLLAIATLLILLWFFSVADPCVIAFARGDMSGAANPIAILGCHVTDGMVSVTVGDMIVRLGLLFLLMGIFGLVGARWELTRDPWRLALLAAMGAVAAFAACVYIQLALVRFSTFTLGVVPVMTLLLATIVAALGARTGAGIAYRRMA
jgi:hypothetical protein